MTTEVWLPIATLLLGWASSVATEALRDQRAARRAEREREREVDERKAAYQRKLITELEVELFELAGIMERLHSEKRKLKERTGQWPVLKISQVHDSSASMGQVGELRRGMEIKRRRLADGDLGELVKKICDAVDTYLAAGDEHSAFVALQEIDRATEKTLHRSGELLRDRYLPSPDQP